MLRHQETEGTRSNAGPLFFYEQFETLFVLQLLAAEFIQNIINTMVKRCFLGVGLCLFAALTTWAQE